MEELAPCGQPVRLVQLVTEGAVSDYGGPYRDTDAASEQLREAHGDAVAAVAHLLRNP